MSPFNTTPVGALLRFVSGGRLLKYADEKALPAQYRPTDKQQPSRRSSNDSEATRVGSHQQQQQQGDKEKGSDPNIVTWYGDDDPENPQNWSTAYKSFVTFLTCLLTFSVYIGSSIYSSGLQGPNSVLTNFGVSQTTALVGLTVFVAGYGLGPMLWSPLSEIPQVGRLSVYMATLAAFVVLNFGVVYAKNIHMLLAFRFLTGFVGSPALATGGATLADMFKPQHITYSLGVWGCAAVCGPVLGPILGNFTAQANGWQWPIWVLIWLSGGVFVILFFTFPETNAENILYRRAHRLRKLTGNAELRAKSEIEVAHMEKSAFLKQTLVRPFRLFLEPVVLVLNLWIGLIYALLYIWFESFPLVFTQGHGLNPGQSGLAFLGVFVGAVLAMVCFCFYCYNYVEPKFEKDGGIKPEVRIQPAVVSAFAIPLCLFGFGWTGMYPSVHWIAPIIFSSLFGIGAFSLFQSVLPYLTDAYPSDAASILAGNDLMRSALGGGFPLFATGMYHNLGIGGASSLLGGIACLFIPVPFVLLKHGHRIRKHSKLARQDEDEQ